MNTDTIVGEPMSTLPTPPSPRPSTPVFPRPLSPSKSDALKANPHPYPIRTTSTAVLSRSNSTASPVTTAHPHQYQYQYYVPQSPSKESPPYAEGRGGRHRYSKSLVNLDSGPKPLPAPSTTTTLFTHRNRSMSSLSSSESENDDSGRGRGDSRGGKVRGIVASFEQGRRRRDSDASSVVSSASDDKPDSTPKRNNARTMEGPTYDETVKLLHSADVVAYSTVTASSVRYSLPQRPPPPNPDDELSVEELLALVSNSDVGASAWERDDVECRTVKRVGDVNPGRREVVQDSAPPPPVVAREISPTSEREQELVQEMSETREMVRALSARIASVEAKIGEMEVVAGELEVRGRQLRVLEEEEDRDDGPPPRQSLLSTLYRTVFGGGGGGVGAWLVRTVLPFSSPKSRSRRETSRTRAVLPMWYKRSWACYLLFLGLGACAFVLREVVRRGMMLRGRRT